MKINPQIFLTSDTHFGHRRLVDWGRPENFNEKIVENWNAVVGKKDIVLHLGDLTMVNFEETENYTIRLNGKKYLILGNHDDRSETWYKKLGFTIIPNSYYSYSNKYGEWKYVLFTHVPTELPETWLNIHGHLHNNSHREHPLAKNHIDIGVDAFNFTPVRLYKILNLWENIKP